VCTAVAALALWVVVDVLHWHYIVGRYESRIIRVTHDSPQMTPSYAFYEVTVDVLHGPLPWQQVHSTVDRIWTVAALVASVAFLAWLSWARRVPGWTGAPWGTWSATVLVTVLLNLLMRWYPTAVVEGGPLHETGWDTRNAAYPLWTAELAMVMVTAAVSARLVLGITEAATAAHLAAR
jgi:hypothetical protein